MRRLSATLAALGIAAALSHSSAAGRAGDRPALTLLAFLDLAETPRAGRASRSQAVFLRSMVAQHPDLHVVVVDVSGQDARARRNRSADWQLGGLRVVPLAALDAPARSRFSGRAPETLLLRESATVLRRWPGFASAAHLDLALREAGSHPNRAAGSRPAGRFAPVR